MRLSLAAVAVAALVCGCGDGAGPPRPAPDGVAAAVQEDGRVLVTWRLDQGPFDDLILESRLDEEAWQLVVHPPPDAVGVYLTFRAVPPELSRLGFRLSGQRGALWGTSNEAVALLPPRAPLFPSITGTDRATLGWSNQSAVSTTPELSRQEVDLAGNGTEWTVLPVPEGATSFQDAWPPAGRAARYRVRYLASATAGFPAYQQTAYSAIQVDGPTVEVIEGVGLRAAVAPLGNASLVVRYFQRASFLDLPVIRGLAELNHWPPSPVARLQVLGSATGPTGATAPVVGGSAWVPPFAIPGPRPLLASGPTLPSTGALVRSGDGRYHAFDGERLWVGAPGALESFGVGPSRYTPCPPRPSVDALGRTHLVYAWQPTAPVGATDLPPPALVWLQHAAAGWEAREVTTLPPFGISGCEHLAHAAPDGTVHLLVAAPGDTRYLVGVAGTFAEERRLPGMPAALSVGSDGTAYAMTTEAFGVRDPLGAWSDAEGPGGWLNDETVLLAGGAGRVAALRNVTGPAGASVAWRERTAGGWGPEERVGDLVAFPLGSAVAELGDDGDLAVVGGFAQLGPAVLERRGGAWQPVSVPSLSALRALGVAAGRLWVAGQQEYLEQFTSPPPLVRTALYEEP